MEMNLKIVTGKGGVGKSIVAAALALRAAKEGKKTLLVELGEPGFLHFLFHHSPREGYQKVSENLYLDCWSGEGSLREYVHHWVRLQKVVSLFFDNPVMKSFIKTAPGLRELAIMGKFTSGIREWGPPLPFDEVVMDSYSTGHFLSLLRAPRGIYEMIRSGPMGVQSRRIFEVLKGPLTQYFLVALPEQMPVQEMKELDQTLQKEFQISAQMVINKWLEIGSGEERLSQLALSLEGQAREFSVFIKKRLQRQREVLESLKGDQPLFLPLVLDMDLLHVVQTLSSYMAEQWTS
ncbi:MAG: arsenical pump-driving ATPase [Bdellovibrio sp.]|nr:MAG: arsenical pump-driving ATPase [Bdellovibrio sp.]